MKKAALLLVAFCSLYLLISCSNPRQPAQVVSSSAVTPSSSSEEGAARYIRVQSEETVVVFALNHSSAAQSLYQQLPLTLPVEDYSNNEKIFYPPQPLDTSDTPLADSSCQFAYYAPWGDCVMFYDDFSPSSGLYALGSAVSGEADISALSGTLSIEACPSP